MVTGSCSHSWAQYWTLLELKGVHHNVQPVPPPWDTPQGITIYSARPHVYRIRYWIRIRFKFCLCLHFKKTSYQDCRRNFNLIRQETSHQRCNTLGVGHPIFLNTVKIQWPHWIDCILQCTGIHQQTYQRWQTVASIDVNVTVASMQLCSFESILIQIITFKSNCPRSDSLSSSVLVNPIHQYLNTCTWYVGLQVTPL